METRIGTDIAEAAALLCNGELVAIPTETVYGLAGNALDPDTVISIFETKERPSFNPLIIHLPDFDAVKPYVLSVPEPLQVIAQHFSPGPISFLLPKSALVPDVVTAGSDNVVVRIPAHSVTQQLLRLLDFPLAAPSANLFGYISPVTARHVLEGLGGRIPYILDGGPCKVGLESTIVGMEGEKVVVFRLGGVTPEQLKEVLGYKPHLALLHEKPNTPGQLRSHYAPAKPLYQGDVEVLLRQHASKRVGVISLNKTYAGVYINRTLSLAGDLHEAAMQLFKAMRELDQADVDIIIAERFPDTGIGMAINDRLKRAAAR